MDTPDPRLIHLVAARYPQVQGLVTMADAVWPLLYAAALYFVSEDWQALPFGAVTLAYLWLRLRWMPRRIDAYYAGRFGRTGEIVVRQNLGMWFSMAIGFNQPLRDMFFAPAYLRIAFLLLALCAYPLWIARRDAPYRLYWLAVFLAGFAAAIQIPWVPIGEGRYLWIRDSNLAIGLALLAAGALDHLLLSHALGGGTLAGAWVEERSDSPESSA